MLKPYRKIPVAWLCVIAIASINASAAADSITSMTTDPDTVTTKKDEPAPTRLRFEPYGVLWTAAAFITMTQTVFI